MTSGFSRTSIYDRDTQTVNITSVDVIGNPDQNRPPNATGLSRYGTEIPIDISLQVGGMTVTPAIGEQWIVERLGGIWRLQQRLKDMAPPPAERSQGQTQIGASGQTVINGSEVYIPSQVRLGETLYRDNNGVLERQLGLSWIPVVPPAGPGAPSSTDEVPEGLTNKYYTAARVAADAPVKTVAGKTGNVAINKSDVGLANVDNTSDIDKPISNATSTALSQKADLVGGLVPVTQLPDEYDEVHEYASLPAFPAVGQSGTIYIAGDTGTLYRWSAGVYSIVGAGGSGGTGPTNTDGLPEGPTNKYFTNARALNALLSVTTADNDIIQRKSGAMVNRTPAQLKTDMSLNNVDNTSDLTKWSATKTLMNTRMNPRIGVVASSATPTANADLYDLIEITGLAVNITSVTLSGTAVHNQRMIFKIKDNGTSRNITWGSAFLGSGIAPLLTKTVANKTHLIGYMYDTGVSKWVCVAVDPVGY